MGKVMTKLSLWNNTDLDMVDRGLIAREAVRMEEIDALVDTGATMLVLPIDVCERLGLTVLDTRKVRLADGSVREIPHVGGLRLSILGRQMVCDVLAMPVGTTPLIGQIPLEALDLIVDPKAREVRVNPESPDMPLLDLLRAA